MQKIKKMIRNTICYVRTYGFFFWLRKLCYEKSKQYQKKHGLILAYLGVFLCDLTKIASPSETTAEKKIISQNAPIWVCWWQGMENAPALVRACVESIKRNLNGRTLYIITKDNYTDFIDPFPETVMNKVRCGNFTYAFLSDLLRFSLLCEYGGIWVDATVFVTKPFPQEIGGAFFSLKQVFKGDFKYVPKKKWVVWMIGAVPHSPYVLAIKEMLLRIVETRNVPVDYFLTDYCMQLLYDSNGDFRQIIDALPINEGLYDMCNELSQEYDVSRSYPQYNKLSYKRQHLLRTNDKPTLYYHLIQEM